MALRAFFVNGKRTRFRSRQLAAVTTASLQPHRSPSHPQGTTTTAAASLAVPRLSRARAISHERIMSSHWMLAGGDSTAHVSSRRSARAFSTITGAEGSSEGGDGDDSTFDVVQDGTERYLVAARELKAGEVIFDGTGGELSTDMSRHSIQVGEGQHLTVADEIDLMNHSCAPNCFITVIGASKGKDATLRATVRESNIRKGELLTLDYNAMEVDMSHPFGCACGVTSCRGHISGFAKLSAAAKEEYLEGRPGGPPPMTSVVRAWVQANNGNRS